MRKASHQPAKQEMFNINGIELTTSVSGRITCEGTLDGFGNFSIVDGMIFIPEDKAQHISLIEKLKNIVSEKGYLIEHDDEMYHLVHKDKESMQAEKVPDLDATRKEVREAVSEAARHAEAAKIAADFSGQVASVTFDESKAASKSATAAQTAVEDAQAAANTAAEDFKEQARGFNRAWAKYAMGQLHQFLGEADQGLRETASHMASALNTAATDHLIAMMKERELAEEELNNAKTKLEALYLGTEHLLNEASGRIAEMEEKAAQANNGQVASGVVINVGNETGAEEGEKVPSQVAEAIDEATDKMTEAIAQATQATSTATIDTIKAFADILEAMRGDRAEDKAEFKKQFEAIEKARAEAEQKLQELKSQNEAEEKEKKARLELKKKKKNKGWGFPSIGPWALGAAATVGIGTVGTLATVGMGAGILTHRAARLAAFAPGAALKLTGTLTGSLFGGIAETGAGTYQNAKGAGSWLANKLVNPYTAESPWYAKAARFSTRTLIGLPAGLIASPFTFAYAGGRALFENTTGAYLSRTTKQIGPYTKKRTKVDWADDRGLSGVANNLWGGWIRPTMNIGVTSRFFTSYNEKAQKGMEKAKAMGMGERVEGWAAKAWATMKGFTALDTKKAIEVAGKIEWQNTSKGVIDRHPDWGKKWRYAPMLMAATLWDQETELFKEGIDTFIDLFDLDEKFMPLAWASNLLAVAKKATSKEAVKLKEIRVNYGSIGAQLISIVNKEDSGELYGFIKALDVDRVVDVDDLNAYGWLGIEKDIKEIAESGDWKTKRLVQGRLASLFGSPERTIGLSKMKDNIDDLKSFVIDFYDEEKAKALPIRTSEVNRMKALIMFMEKVYVVVKPFHKKLHEKKEAA